MDYLGFKELQKFNKCITSLITDFEQAILAQVSDKWKPITLADGAFELDELKRDISTSDAKFAVRNLTSRAGGSKFFFLPSSCLGLLLEKPKPSVNS